MSKKLDSILSQVPPATARGNNAQIVDYQNSERLQTNSNLENEKTVRITAVIPISLKNEIKSYLEKNPLDTEKTVVLKCMKSFGFNIKEDWLIDKRRLR